MTAHPHQIHLEGACAVSSVKRRLNRSVSCCLQDSTNASRIFIGIGIGIGVSSGNSTSGGLLMQPVGDFAFGPILYDRVEVIPH